MKQTTEKIHTEDILCDMFLKMMEHGIIPWDKPWFGREEVQYNLFAPKDKWYNGINQMILPLTGGYMTYNDMKEHGIHIKKGEKSWPLFFKKPVEKIEEVTNSDGTITKVRKCSFVFRYYQVWHVSQTDISQELLDKYERKIDEEYLTTELSENVKKVNDILHEYMDREGISYHEEGAKACYRFDDSIHMPPMHTFVSDVEFVGTKSHECTHSTGAAKRLNRDMTGDKGTHKYAKEELVAEMGSAILLHKYGISTQKSDRNNAAYLQSWMSHIKENKKHLYNAASQARKAVQFILGEKIQTKYA